MSQSTNQHRCESPKSVRVAVITVSDTRTLETDKGGQLIVETIIVDGSKEYALCPRDRYACMRNVFFIPTVACLESWLSRCGFSHIRCVDITPTTRQEQRKTEWIDSDSLDAFLAPGDDRYTVEGHPAPVRAVVVATRK